MKKQIGVFLTATTMAAYLCGCGGAEQVAAAGAETKNNEDGLKIVTTIFPEYDWVNNVLGEQAANAQVTLLLDNGVDLHSYQPSAQDIVTISDCDVFVYVGGESDGWVKDTLAEASNKDMVVIDLMEVLGDSVKEEEVVEGMESEEHDHEHEDGDHDHEDADHEEHEHEDEDEHEHHHEEGEIEYDEHVWLSLKNATVLCNAIADGLAQADPANADSYHANAEAYTAELTALDAEYQAAVDAAANKTLVFADRFPFRYMVDDYSLEYYAAFVGCSAETEASFETVMFLANKVDELGLHTILTIEGSDGKLAQTVKGSTASGDQEIKTMNSLQSVSLKEAQNGISYLSVMQDNLEVLKEVLQ